MKDRQFAPEEIRLLTEAMRAQNGHLNWRDHVRLGLVLGRTPRAVYYTIDALWGVKQKRAAEPRLIAGSMIDDFSISYRQLITEIWDDWNALADQRRALC